MRHDRSGLRGRLVVAAQWNDRFMAEAAAWRDGPCAAQYFDGADHMRDDLLGAVGPGDVLIYLGHSTPSAWLGFRGIRADHLGHVRAPLACVIALTCHGTAPGSTGAGWYAHGKAACVIGPPGEVAINDVLALSRWLRDAIAQRAVQVAGDIVTCAPGLACIGAPDARLGAPSQMRRHEV